jgi:hypothetical protein
MAARQLAAADDAFQGKAGPHEEARTAWERTDRGAAVVRRNIARPVPERARTGPVGRRAARRAGAQRERKNGYFSVILNNWLTRGDLYFVRTKEMPRFAGSSRKLIK